ncbi:hypothetical protein DHEL01_v210079 [Diaporthe helianthi]|uniref:Uncharacterized protein n=1 Tax=Diaporthe helianthi TaxID=158607 RepID=A0A2P5HMP5_DIAHE|nr:hypothetical protein DHEL01_v210079 [Diaporthe helianthi]
MSAASDVEADMEPLARFDLWPNLPAEVIKVIHEFLADFQKHSPSQKLAPFTALHSEWQHEVEPEAQLWGHMRLGLIDLPVYRMLLSQRRGDSLSAVSLWMSIGDNVLDVTHTDQAPIFHVETRARVARSIIHCVSTLFKCLNYAKSMGSQRARKGVEFHTQITIPKDVKVSSLVLRNVIGQFEIDFSQLPMTDVIPSILNQCPSLKTVSLFSIVYGLHGRYVLRWVSHWSHKIESLKLGNTFQIYEVLGSLGSPQQDTTTITWPNLKEFSIECPVDRITSNSKHRLEPILAVIPVALISLPSIRSMTIILNCSRTTHTAIDITLRFELDSSQLTISARDKDPETRLEAAARRGASRFLREPAGLWDVADEEIVMAAVVDIQAAVQKLYGRDLTVILPKTAEPAEPAEPSP